MNNLWKGLVVGAVTGAAIGLVVDGVGRGRDAAIAAGRFARDHGPDVATAIAGAATAGAERIRDADLPDKLRNAVQSAATSDTADSLRASAAHAADAVTAAAKGAAAKAHDATT